MSKFKIMHTRTRQIVDAYFDYLTSSKYSIYHAYLNPSYEKEKAFERCREIETDFNGKNLKVISHNTFVFSAGFIGEIEQEKVFVYITPSYNRYITLEEIQKYIERKGE